MNIDNVLHLLIHHPDPKIRKNAAEELSNSGELSRYVLEGYAQGLCDSDSGVKDICARALANAPEEKLSEVAIVMSPLIAHNDIEIRNLASDILLNIGIPAVEPLLSFLEDSSFEVRQFAVDILGKIAHPSALPYIYDLLGDPEIVVKTSAIEAIGNMRELDSFYTLAALYDEANEDTKPVIIEAIGKIGGAEAQDFLINLLKVEEDIFIQTTCIDALALGGEDVNICMNLLNELPTAPKELQPILLKTIFAIASRQEQEIELPDNLRFIAYNALDDNDPDIRTAGLLALGNNYKINDIRYLIKEVAENNPDTQLLILGNLLAFSDPENVEEFFIEFCYLTEVPDGSCIEFLSLLPSVWEYTKRENADIAINTIIRLMVESNKLYSTEIIELLMKIDYFAVIENLKSLLNEGSSEQIDDTLEIIRNLMLKELLPELESLALREEELSLRINDLINHLSN